jgi:imidazolonepropionase-like amidohydrolase
MTAVHPARQARGFDRRSFVAAALVVVSPVAPVLPAARALEITAVVGATVHPISSAEIADGVVLFEDSRIVAVGGRAETPVPPGATVVNAAGQHLWPGLIDCYTVLGLVEIGSVRATVDYTESGRLNPAVEAWTAVNPSSELIPVARAGGVLLAVTTPRGGLVAGRASLIALDGWTVEDLVRRREVGLIVNWPAMPLVKSKKLPASDWSDSVHELSVLLDEARAYADASRAKPRDETSREADVAWSALTPVVDKDIPVWIVAGTEAQIRAAVDWADEAGVRMVLVDGGDGWRCADVLASRSIPVVLDVHRLPSRDYEPYDTPFTAPARLHAAGVRVAFFTGSASSVRDLPNVAARAVAHGLPADVGARALTLTAAEIAGVADRYGSLEPGKSATCILVDGDLLDTRMHVRRAWIDGHAIDLTSRHTRLWETYRARPKPTR